MTLEEAKNIVAEIERENMDGTVEEIIDHVRNTLSLLDPAPLGATTFIDYEDEESLAYKMVLEAAA